MFDLPRYIDDLALVAKTWEYLDEAMQEDIAGYEKKKRNNTVVKKPLAKFRVPVNSVVKKAAPRSETAPFGEGSLAPISSTCCKNSCSVSIGTRMKLSRSSSRGMPSGSLAAQVRAGPEMAVPKPTIVPNRARISRSAAGNRGMYSRSSTRKAGCNKSLRTMAKTNGNTISLATKAAASSPRTKRPPRNIAFGSDGRGCSSGSTAGMILP